MSTRLGEQIVSPYLLESLCLSSQMSGGPIAGPENHAHEKRPLQRSSAHIETPFLVALPVGRTLAVMGKEQVYRFASEPLRDGAEIPGSGKDELSPDSYGEDALPDTDEWEAYADDPDIEEAVASAAPEGLEGAGAWEAPFAVEEQPSDSEWIPEDDFLAEAPHPEEEWEARAEPDAGTPDPVALELESPPAAEAAVVDFVALLGEEWTRRRGGSPAAEAISQWLLRDWRDTLEGARQRYETKYTDDAIARAWMVSRKEQMGFQLATGLRELRDFHPPAGHTALISSALIRHSDKAPVAPLLVRFVEELRRRFPRFGVFNYRGHGGGSFHDRGHSLDLTIDGRDERGFYPPEAAADFLRAVHAAASAVRAEWRAIYNDFSAGNQINRETGYRHVVFVGTVRRNAAQKITGLNWHGPHPLILHFHLDLTPRPDGPASTGAASRAIVGTAPLGSVANPAPAPGKPAAELVRFAQRVLNVVENERLESDGVPGPLTRGALERFRRKHGLGPGGVLDAKTELALAQRVLEELAQQSLFAQPGVFDDKTAQSLTLFKAERGLGSAPILDERTRVAMTDALARRSSPSVGLPGAPRLMPLLGRIRAAPKTYIQPRTQRAVVDGHERAEPRGEVWCQQAGISLDEGALARVVASEVGSMPPQYMLAITDATMNDARAKGITVFQRVTMLGLKLKGGKTPTSAGYFGRQSGRWCSSIQDPTHQHLQAARIALTASTALIARDGRRWVDGRVMDRGLQAGKKLRYNAVSIVEKWGAEGWEWIGPTFDADERTLLLDPYRLMIFRFAGSGVARTKHGMDAMLDGRRRWNVAPA